MCARRMAMTTSIRRFFNRHPGQAAKAALIRDPGCQSIAVPYCPWIPAFAGMTKWGGLTNCGGLTNWGGVTDCSELTKRGAH